MANEFLQRLLQGEHPLTGRRSIIRTPARPRLESRVVSGRVVPIGAIPAIGEVLSSFLEDYQAGKQADKMVTALQGVNPELAKLVGGGLGLQDAASLYQMNQPQKPRSISGYNTNPDGSVTPMAISGVPGVNNYYDLQMKLAEQQNAMRNQVTPLQQENLNLSRSGNNLAVESANRANAAFDRSQSNREQDMSLAQEARNREMAQQDFNNTLRDWESQNPKWKENAQRIADAEMLSKNFEDSFKLFDEEYKKRIDPNSTYAGRVWDAKSLLDANPMATALAPLQWAARSPEMMNTGVLNSGEQATLNKIISDSTDLLNANDPKSTYDQIKVLSETIKNRLGTIRSTLSPKTPRPTMMGYEANQAPAKFQPRGNDTAPAQYRPQQNAPASADPELEAINRRLSEKYNVR